LSENTEARGGQSSREGSTLNPSATRTLSYKNTNIKMDARWLVNDNFTCLISHALATYPAWLKALSICG